MLEMSKVNIAWHDVRTLQGLIHKRYHQYSAPNCSSPNLCQCRCVNINPKWDARHRNTTGGVHVLVLWARLELVYNSLDFRAKWIWPQHMHSIMCLCLFIYCLCCSKEKTHIVREKEADSQALHICWLLFVDDALLVIISFCIYIKVFVLLRLRRLRA